MTVISLPTPGGFAEHVAAEVRALMGRHKVTQTKLAEVLGIPQSAVSLRINGKREFTLSELDALARFFGFSDAVEMIGGTRVGPRPGGPDGGLPQSRGGSMDTRWYPYQNVA